MNLNIEEFKDKTFIFSARTFQAKIFSYLVFKAKKQPENHKKVKNWQLAFCVSVWCLFVIFSFVSYVSFDDPQITKLKY